MVAALTFHAFLCLKQKMGTQWEPMGVPKTEKGPHGDLGFSVPNSSYGLICVKIRAKYGNFLGKNTGVIRAKIRAKLKFL